MVATKEGIVRLTDTIVLQHILFVPTLQCNLILVSQLSDDIRCSVHFTSNLCAIQDHRLREVIGMGERRDGLYYLRGSMVQAVSVAQPQSLEL